MSTKEEQETFLVILNDSSTGSVRAFLWQGTWEGVHKLKHDTWSLNIYLLMAEEPQTWTGYGTQLLHVVDLEATMQASNLMHRCLWHLSRLSPTQRALELKALQERLIEEQRSVEQVLASPAERDRTVKLWVAENLFGMDVSKAKLGSSEEEASSQTES